MPGALRQFRFPKALDRRLQDILDKQDRGEKLTPAERQEAEGLVEVSRTLSLLKSRVQRATAGGRVATAAVSTGADGVASPGTWTLGDIPGTQSLIARLESAELVLTATGTGTPSASESFWPTTRARMSFGPPGE